MTDTTSRSSSVYSTPDFTSKPRPAEKNVHESAPSPDDKKSARPLFGHRFGILDMAVIASCIACLVAIILTDSAWLAWSLAAVCTALMCSPEVIQRCRMNRRLTLGSIFIRFRKCGLNPVLTGDMITWEHDGKKNSVRLVNGCQLQVFREYPLQPEMNGKFVSAASATMDEVFSAKIGVRRAKDGGDGSIYFSTEMLCSSMKDFDRILPATVEILDTAEDRQRENLRELLTADEKQPRKIGFRADGSRNCL